MLIRASFAAVFVAALFVFLTPDASAQGVIVPIICERRPCVPPPRPAPLPNVLPVKSINIDVRIDGQVATTKLEQVFRNDTKFTLEGTYFFPIPESASIVEFAIWENGKKLVGEVRTREEARRIYDEIVRRQRDPGLLEYAGKDLFQASIFPIPPNSDKKLEMTYTQVLKAESGTVAYRYPLGTGRNLWRDAVPTESRPGVVPQKFGTVAGRVEIVAREAIRNIYSPTHRIDVRKKNETSASVSFETSGDSADFRLFYGISPGDFGLSLMTYREPGKDGYFLLQLSPKDSVSERELVNKDIVFVLDTSGSMADRAGEKGNDGSKLDKARNALLFGIRTLREGDRFNVISFAGEERLMEGGLIAANAEGRRRGEEFVGRLTPTGGTNINDALRAALRQFDGSDRPKMLVFLTDGLPTVGETSAEQIVRNAAGIKVEGLRLFAFGVGYDVNTLLLDKLAAENGGAADYVEPQEDLEIRVSNFFAKVSSPVLTGIELDFAGVQTDLVYPRRATDLFRGSQLTLIGRYRNVNDLTNVVLKLTGRTGREPRSFEYRGLRFPVRDESNEFLPRLWATRRVGWLMEQIRTNGENKELRDEVVSLGTRFGIVTPYTSFLAIEGASGNVSATSVGTGLGRGSGSGNRTRQPASSVSGAEAVRMSKDSKVQQEADKVAGDEPIGTTTVRRIGIKTFYLRDGIWFDGEFTETPKLAETEIRFMSDEYFELVGRDAELGKYLAVGERVVLVWKGKVIRIVGATR